MARLDYQIASRDYDRSRALDLDALEGWRRAVSSFVSPNGKVLDLGAGTGVFSTALATWFDVDVLAVEPSSGMIEAARRERLHPRVAYAIGNSESIPAAADTFEVAWLSTVIHHFDDLTAASKEIARVLKPDGLVLVRSAFPERSGRIALFRFFPEARKALSSFPTMRDLEDAWAPAFRLEHVEDVPQVTAADMGAYRERFERDLRETDTTLSRLTETEYAAGVARVDAAARLSDAKPVVDYLTLAVFRGK